jgi:hypothetical protein
MFKSEHLQEKWAPVLSHKNLPEISDSYKKAVTSILLENQESFMREERLLTEASPTNHGPINTATTGTGNIAGFDPILISLIRRSMPNLIAYDIAGVQPMNGPTGLIFAMRSRYQNQTGPEALFNEANQAWTGTPYNKSTSSGGTAQSGTNPALLNDLTGGGQTQGNYGTAGGMSTATAESLGDADSNQFPEMAFSIEKIAVTAKSRALKAEYTIELAQDLKAIHGLDAETELANILAAEILTEINREVVRTVFKSAKSGAQQNTANQGVFDMDVDSNGRWSVEKFKGLLFQIERDCNAIAKETRRGKGNILICSSDIASALSMAGVLDYTPALQTNLNVDDTGNTFVGTLNGRIKVYIDPYSALPSEGATASQFYIAGYKGTNAYDAGLFYCPYVPLQMVRAIGQDTFQPKIGFKTRYGMVLNPFAKGYDAALSDSDPLAGGNVGTNVYYRRTRVTNLM